MPEGLSYIPDEEIKKSEQEQRRERYLANLSNIDRLNLSEIYPPEVSVRNWKRVEDRQAIEDLMQKQFGQSSIHARKELTASQFYVDSETGEVFAAPAFGGKESKPEAPTQLLLDMLFAATRLAPWARFRTLSGDPNGRMFQDNGKVWTVVVGNNIRIDAKIFEDIMNGAGDPKYTAEQKQSFIMANVARMIHEGVHINNGQEVVIAGPELVIAETGPATAEYLTFPGRNQEAESTYEDSIALLNGDEKKKGSYGEALLCGILLIMNEDSLLPANDDKEALISSVNQWKQKLLAMPPKELLDYRRRAEATILLSKQDVKIRQKLGDIVQRFPNTLGHLEVAKR